MKFPANVDDIANVSHACCGFAKLVISVLSNNTAGTLEMILLKTPVTKLSAVTPLWSNSDTCSNKIVLMPVVSIAPVMTNNPAKNANKSQSSESSRSGRKRDM